MSVEALVLDNTILILQRFNVRLAEDDTRPILRNFHTGPLVLNAVPFPRNGCGDNRLMTDDNDDDDDGDGD